MLKEKSTFSYTLRLHSTELESIFLNVSQHVVLLTQP